MAEVNESFRNEMLKEIQVKRDALNKIEVAFQMLFAEPIAPEHTNNNHLPGKDQPRDKALLIDRDLDGLMIAPAIREVMLEAARMGREEVRTGELYDTLARWRAQLLKGAVLGAFLDAPNVLPQSRNWTSGDVNRGIMHAKYAIRRGYSAGFLRDRRATRRRRHG